MSWLRRNITTFALIGISWVISGCHGDKTHTDQTPPEPSHRSEGPEGQRRPKLWVEWESDAFMIFAIVVGFVIGLITLLIIVCVCRQSCMRRRAAREKQRMLNREPMRLDLQVYRADPYDVNRTMSGIPTITDIWREMQVRPASPSLAEKTSPTLPYKEKEPVPYASIANL